MRRQLVPALLAFLALTVLTGVVYPLVVTGVAQVAFPGRADGSLLERDGAVVGSRLIGQSFAQMWNTLKFASSNSAKHADQLGVSPRSRIAQPECAHVDNDRYWRYLLKLWQQEN